MRVMLSRSVVFVLSLLACSSSSSLAQQPYEGTETTDCDRTDNSNSVLGYFCNGLNSSCQAFLIFRSQPPYTTVSSIANLLASDSSHLAKINGVPQTATFETNREVIVPVNCSCSSNYYQANTTYTIRNRDTYLLIANNTFQALSNCQSLKHQNTFSERDLIVGEKIRVPVRCACPTKNQTDSRVSYLLSYLIQPGDEVSKISLRFDADMKSVLEGNEISEDTIIYPFTTLLIPLKNPPSFSQLRTPSPPPPPPPPPPPSRHGNSSNKILVILVSAAAGIVALFSAAAAIVYCFFFRKKQRLETCTNKPVRKIGEEDESSEEVLRTLSSIAQSLTVYSFTDLEAATEKFSSSCRVKGSVYRGIINGDLSAIKRTKGDVMKEVNLLRRISHFNLIRLSGISHDPGHGDWFLVYEYAANGPLSDWIYRGEKFLDSRQRMQIALDVAQGLNYLHSHTNPPCVHKNLQSCNILLDDGFRAKISNFRMARSGDGDEGEFALTRHIVGTTGYMAPEYLENGFVSPMLDVYAFGVILLELLSGREVSGGVREEREWLLEVRDGLGFVDPSLIDEFPPHLAIFFARLIHRCLDSDPAGRPTMDDILHSLLQI